MVHLRILGRNAARRDRGETVDLLALELRVVRDQGSGSPPVRAAMVAAAFGCEQREVLRASEGEQADHDPAQARGIGRGAAHRVASSDGRGLRATNLTS